MITYIITFFSGICSSLLFQNIYEKYISRNNNENLFNNHLINNDNQHYYDRIYQNL